MTPCVRHRFFGWPFDALQQTDGGYPNGEGGERGYIPINYPPLIQWKYVAVLIDIMAAVAALATLAWAIEWRIRRREARKP